MEVVHVRALDSDNVLVQQDGNVPVPYHKYLLRIFMVLEVS